MSACGVERRTARMALVNTDHVPRVVRERYEEIRGVARDRAAQRSGREGAGRVREYGTPDADHFRTEGAGRRNRSAPSTTTRECSMFPRERGKVLWPVQSRVSPRR